MNNKNILIAVIVAVIATGAYWFLTMDTVVAPQSEVNTPQALTPESRSGDRIATPTSTEQPATEGKLKVGNFSGKLEKVDTGCFADGECYVVVDGKHITTTIGWSRDTLGSIQGVESFGDLEKHMGEEVEVYAKDNGDGTYSLYGSEGFYVKLK